MHLGSASNIILALLLVMRGADKEDRAARAELNNPFLEDLE
jgi:hypothetical protein